MANPEHLKALLRAQGSETIWENWRKANPYTQPDLSDLNQDRDALHETKLRNLNLQNAIFINANLKEVDLSGANLEGADLSGAILDKAILHEVKLNGAKLNGATLKEARLQNADLSQAEMTAVNLTRAELTNTILNGATLNRATLNGANLRHAHLHDVDLSDAEMEDIDLSEAQLESSNLSRANLNRANLDKTTFKETQLHATVLREASLEQANLLGALGLSEDQLAGTNLKDTDLPPDVQKERIHLFDDKLNRIENASQNLQTLFFALLASCMYSWLTIASTTHAQLIADTATSPLPIIGAKVSIINFYQAMPCFLLIFYIYFHQNLQRLWDMLASLPAVFPDGTRLDERSQPRHVSGFVRARCFLLKESSAPGDFLYGYLFMFLAWFSVPCTLLGFWWSFLPRRDLQGDITTVALTILITMTVAFGLASYQRALSALQTKHQRPQDSPYPFHTVYRTIRKYALAYILISAIIICRNIYIEFLTPRAISIYEILILFVMGNLTMYFGMPSTQRKLQVYLAEHQTETWITQLLSQIQSRVKYLDMCAALFGFSTVAMGFIFLIFRLEHLWIRLILLAFVLSTILGGIRIFQQWLMEKWWAKVRPHHTASSDINTPVSAYTRLIPVVAFSLSLIFLMKINQPPTCFPSNPDNAWNMQERMQERTLLDRLLCYPVANLNREDISTKTPNWPGVLLEGKKEENDRKKGLDLVTGASLERANLKYALANETFFARTDFYKANLEKAMMEFTDFRRAVLQKVNLDGAHLPWSDLRDADLRWATLKSANLFQSKLDSAKMSYFTNCHTQPTDYRAVNLADADLRNASLKGADLKGANLKKANLNQAGLSYAFLNGANLSQTILKNASLEEADLSSTTINSICGNTSTVNLTGVNLAGANLEGVYWKNAKLNNTNLYKANLTGARELSRDQLQHACIYKTTILPEEFRHQKREFRLANSEQCIKDWKKINNEFEKQ